MRVLETLTRHALIPGEPMTTFAVRKKIIDELISDGAWCAKWHQCTSLREFENVIADFCKEKGYEIANVHPRSK